jgi:flagellar protein FliO/FliZ
MAFDFMAFMSRKNKMSIDMIMKNLCLVMAVSCYLFSWEVTSQENITTQVHASTTDKNRVLSEQVVVLNTEIEGTAVQKTTLNEDDSLLVLSEVNNTKKTPQVGKHVMANMNAGSMIISLLMVLVLIVICAFVLKRFNFAQHGISQMKVVTSLSLGAKERVVVIQVGEQQLLLGVTHQQITLIEKLSEPLVTQGLNTAALPKNLLSFLVTKKTE